MGVGDSRLALGGSLICMSPLIFIMGTNVPYILLAGGGAYVATSLYLLRYPLTRHRGTNPLPPAVLIAHRGGAGEGYENTLNAFERAVGVGADMLELDVHLSRDGKVVVAHDSNLARLTDSQINIKDSDYQTLPSLKTSIPIDFLPGKVYSEPHSAEEKRRLPTLEQVLASFPSAQVNIDLKSPGQELVSHVERVIRQQGAEGRCVWGNFSQETTDRCYKANPEVGLLFSMPRFLKLYLLFYTGLLPFLSLRETHLEIPMPSIFLDPRYRTVEGNVNMARLPPFILKLADWVIMSPLLFRHLAARGIYTYLWVLNTEEQFEKAFRMGATGVMTDYPSKLAKFLEAKQKLS